MIDGEKLQKDLKGLPVVWKILASHDLTDKIEAYAHEQGISEAEVWRRGVEAFIAYSKPKKRTPPARNGGARRNV